MSHDSQIHETVRARYAGIAQVTSSSGCCGDSGCGCDGGFYSVDLIKTLDSETVNLSLGCGDPVGIASLKPGDTVLDLGSGGGIDCFLAARQVGETGHVIGVDMTPEMLAKANAARDRMGLHNVEFRHGHIEALPVDDNSVDVILSNCVINLAPDKVPVFREAFRVLKPGGRVSISDIVTEGDFSDDLRADGAKWAECVTGAIDAAVYTDMMADVGFIDIQVVDKVGAEDIVPRQEGMPRIFSARITAHKPL